MTTDNQVDVFQAIAAPIRREILQSLALNGEQSISAISSSYPISRQAVTRHIQILESSGVVFVNKVGREQVCQLNAAVLKEVQRWVSFYEQFWDNKLDALGEYLGRSERDDE